MKTEMTAMEKEAWLAGILMSILKWQIITKRWDGDLDSFEGPLIENYVGDESCGMCWATQSLCEILGDGCDNCLCYDEGYICCKEYDKWSNLIFENGNKAAEAMYKKLLRVADKIMAAEVIE